MMAGQGTNAEIQKTVSALQSDERRQHESEREDLLANTNATHVAR